MITSDKNRLIFDLGMHRGEDTAYYLNSGYRVIAVDADPIMVKEARKKFRSYIKDGRLVVLNFALTSTDNQSIKLNISEWSYWTSLKEKIANRAGKMKDSVNVTTIRLDTLMKKYGEPYYCKIDLEGYDATVSSTLTSDKFRPKYISLETECIGDNDNLTPTQALETLDILHKLGYKKFKLIDQATLTVLDKKRPFYIKPESTSFSQSLLAKIGLSSTYYLNPKRQIKKLSNLYNFDFEDSSGPFGTRLMGRWSDYNTAKDLLLYHRGQFFQQKDVKKYAFWCDWHATR